MITAAVIHILLSRYRNLHMAPYFLGDLSLGFILYESYRVE